MRYPRILSAIRSARWAITPTALQAITDTLGAHLRGQLGHAPGRAISLMTPQETAETQAEKPRPMVGVAVIEVHGIIGKHLSAMETECGGCDVDAIAASLDAALAAPEVTAILLDFDSPGGVVTGVPELAAKIREADRVKPVYAYTSAQCCSAAYWLAAAARKVYTAPSADLGSIGVYMALVDDTEWWSKQGYKLELIKAGEFKAMGLSGKGLTDKEREMLQADVDATYAMFVGDIRKRRAIADSTAQGQTFMGEAAVSAFLADAIYPDRMAVLRAIAGVG